MSLEGHLLAASPQMTDPNFARAVVLLVQHGDEGALGVVLNRPSQLQLSEVWEQVGQGPCELDQPLQLGGPVEGPLVALHEVAELSERELLPGVYFASQRGALSELVEHPTGLVRLFSGYAGWGSGQLENEIRVGAWLTAQASPQHVFFTGDDLWRVVVSEIGGQVILGRGDIKHVPPEPWMN